MKRIGKLILIVVFITGLCMMYVKSRHQFTVIAYAKDDLPITFKVSYWGIGQYLGMGQINEIKLKEMIKQTLIYIPSLEIIRHEQDIEDAFTTRVSKIEIEIPSRRIK